MKVATTVEGALTDVPARARLREVTLLLLTSARPGFELVHPALVATGDTDEQWDDMGLLISDEVLDAFAVVGIPDEVPHLLHARFGDVITRLRTYTPYDIADDVEERIRTGLQALRP